MKKALVHENRIVQVVAAGEEFEVHESLEWFDCPDDATPETYEFKNGAVVQKSAPSAEERIAANTAAIQSELDRQAKAKGYDNIVSACSYGAQAPSAPFQAEGAAFLAWRSAVWTHAYQVLANVEAGSVPMPTPAEAVAAMPVIVWPTA